MARLHLASDKDHELAKRDVERLPLRTHALQIDEPIDVLEWMIARRAVVDAEIVEKLRRRDLPLEV